MGKRRVQVDLAGQTVTLVLDGVTALQSSISGSPVNGSSVATVGIDNYTGPSTPLSIFLDNVLISAN